MGIDDDILEKAKYTKREKKGGKWVYTYTEGAKSGGKKEDKIFDSFAEKNLEQYGKEKFLKEFKDDKVSTKSDDSQRGWFAARGFSNQNRKIISDYLKSK